MNIIHTTLQTSNLQKTNQFYHEVLGFTIFDETEKSFTIAAGISTCTFTNEDVVGEPFYHFAFDLPANQFLQAKKWVKERTTLLTEKGVDEIHFARLQATSIYFEDPSGNIVEFIARFKHDVTSDEPFSITSLQKISEMSLIVQNKIDVLQTLRAHHIVARDQSEMENDTLAFMSDQQTSVYLLVANASRRWLFSEKRSQVFPIELTLDNGIVIGVNEEKAFFVR